MTEYTAEGARGILAFATRVPGHILPVEVRTGQTYMVHRHGFLCSTPGVDLSVGFQQSLGAGIFGGDGFLLQRLAGNCQAWIELDGEVVPYDLGPEETMRVHPGDGIFLAALTGPGRIWLQSLPLSNLAHALRPYLGSAGETAQQVGAGAIIGSVLRGLSR